LRNRKLSGAAAWEGRDIRASARLCGYAPALALFFASGLLLTVIQPPPGWSFLAWGALVPFAVACTPQVRPRTLVLTSFVVGFGYWLGNVYWIMPITLIGWLAMSLYLSVSWVLPALGVRWCRAKGIPLFIALPILVAGWERLQGFPMDKFYWRFLGHSQYQHLALIQIADFVGAAGVSFVVAMVNGLLADFVLWLTKMRQERLPGPHASRFTLHTSPTHLLGLIVTALVVAGTVLYGQWRLGQTKDFVTEGPTIASLQSNVPQSVKRSHEKSVDIFNELMDMSKCAEARGAELVVWPETMVQGLLDPGLWPYLNADFDQAKAFHRALSEHAQGGAYVLVGAYGADIMKDPLGEYYVGNFNSAYLYRPDGTRAPGRYDKIHLVLFGEYIPFRHQFPWLFEKLKMFLPEGWNPDYSLEHGTRYTLFEMARQAGDRRPKAGGQSSNPQSERSGPYHFGVIICYEDTIPYVARNFTLDEQGRKRIDWLVNISNDGWFVRFQENPARVIPSTELPQHAAICTFRAVENRLPILRSVNTGISCLIESTGRIREGYLAGGTEFPRRPMARTAMAGWFLDRLPIDSRVTFYSQHGEWFADSCAALFAAALAWPLGAWLWRPRAKAQQRFRARS
jgi:apolipoprotein N-acyltransferase